MNSTSNFENSRSFELKDRLNFILCRRAVAKVINLTDNDNLTTFVSTTLQHTGLDLFTGD